MYLIETSCSANMLVLPLLSTYFNKAFNGQQVHVVTKSDLIHEANTKKWWHNWICQVTLQGVWGVTNHAPLYFLSSSPIYIISNTFWALTTYLHRFTYNIIGQGRFVSLQCTITLWHSLFLLASSHYNILCCKHLRQILR